MVEGRHERRQMEEKDMALYILSERRACDKPGSLQPLCTNLPASHLPV